MFIQELRDKAHGTSLGSKSFLTDMVSCWLELDNDFKAIHLSNWIRWLSYHLLVFQADTS